MSSSPRYGIGFDAHPFAAGKKLVLGGVEIAFDKGLEGWSDADALTHAIIDALLGAASLGDIGVHFPPGESEFKGISSLALLEKTGAKLQQHGWRIGNIDATVIAEHPKLRDYVERMRQQLGKTMKIDIEQVSVKASTANTLGFIGRGEGIAVMAIASVERETT